MPIIPTYRRQTRYQAPGVQMNSSAPQRLPKAYENTLQELSSFSKSVMQYLEPKIEKKNQKETSGPRRGAAAVSKSAVSALSMDAALKENSRFAADPDLQIRLELAESVRNTLSEGKAVTTAELDEFAASHISADRADTPAAWDYMMLRAAAQADQQTAVSQLRRQMTGEAEQLVRSVGAAAPSVQALDAYLSVQMPVLEDRLKEEGFSQATVRQKTASLRAQTAAQNIRHSLTAGNMDSAQDIFQKYAKEMTAKEREDCAAKIRLCAADLHARSLWERAASETDGSPQQRETWALAQLNEEKNSDLKTDVEENLTLLRAAAQTQEHLQQAQLYHSVAVSHNGEAQSKVAAQTLLDPYQMRLARRAALETDRGILGSAHPEKFNQLYFSDSEKEILNAYEKNQISAKEYCLLQAVRHERAAGQETGQCRLLSKGIDLWSEKKGLSQQDAQFVKYAVLSADGGIENQLDAWQRIKTLFDI